MMELCYLLYNLRSVARICRDCAQAITVTLQAKCSKALQKHSGEFRDNGNVQ